MDIYSSNKAWKWSPTRGLKDNGKSLKVKSGSNYKALSGKILLFWIGLGYRRWSLTRNGRTWIFNCIQELGFRISGHATEPRFLIHASLCN